MFNMTNMFNMFTNILNVFNHEWFNKFTAPGEQWLSFFQNKPSLKKLTDLADSLSESSSSETASLNLKNFDFGEWANWLNNSSFPFVQSFTPKIKNSIQNSFRTTLLGLLPGLILGLSGLFI